MAYAKLKAESYKNLSGINTKVSDYLQKQTECSDLVNLDFFVPGAWTTRPGVTSALSSPIGVTVDVVTGGASVSFITANINNIYEHTFTNGSSLLFLSTRFEYDFDEYSGASLVGSSHVIVSEPIYLTGQSLALNIIFLQPGTKVNYIAKSLNDYLIYCGRDPKRLGNSSYPPSANYNGSTTCLSGFPALQASNGFSAGFFTSGGALTGTITYAVGYINNRNMYGPIRKWDGTPVGITYTGGGASGAVITGFTLSDSQISGHGIKGYALWRNDWGNGYFLAATCAISGLTLVDNNNSCPFVGDLPEPEYIYPSVYDSFGTGFGVVDSGYGGFQPLVMEVHNRRMYYANIPGATTVGIRGIPNNTFYNPSSLWFCDVNDFECFRAESRRDIDPEDGFGITALKSFLGRLVIFKDKMVYELIGSEAAGTVSVVRRTGGFGCLNQRSIAEYSVYLTFLDEKGIVRYNGSSFELISWKIQPIFDRMNLSAARETACAVEYKNKNEVWFSIPVDGSSVNNLTVVYNYAQDAFTTHKGFIPQSAAYAQVDQTSRTVYAGGISGNIGLYGTSFLTDFGVGFTQFIRTRLHHEINESTTKQYRRLYITHKPGVTLGIEVNAYADFSPTAAFSSTLVIGNNQDRLDFGIPSKSIAYTMTAFSTTHPITFYGYTNEYRFQRSV